MMMLDDGERQANCVACDLARYARYLAYVGIAVLVVATVLHRFKREVVNDVYEADEQALHGVDGGDIAGAAASDTPAATSSTSSTE